jgi:crotonobetainyl-CoA:carnitine CoA-transferase CaiB-like acyl-CoA transferase
MNGSQGPLADDHEADAQALSDRTAHGALRHLRVLDLSRVRAGPTCCRVLADFGADVIKIEAPDGVDPNEGMSGPRLGYDMQNLHRNKRSMTLNLKLPEGREVFLKLVETADVVVENFRPDVKDRMGIDYASLRARNPRIILASISGFGQDGPYRMRAGFDQIAQGMGGLMWITGQPGQGPMRAGAAVADSTAGLNAAIGILVALTERDASGEGQWVQTSLLQSQIALCDFQAARYLVDNVVPPQAGNDHPYSTPMGVLETSDGYINIGVGGEAQWKTFCRAIERPDLIDHPDFAANPDRLRHRPELAAILGPIMRTRTSAAWLDLFEKCQVPAGPIYRMDEVFADPQVQHLGIVERVNHHSCGEIALVGQPITLSRTPASITTAMPDKGAQTADVLTEAGYSAKGIDALRLAGVV